MRPRRLHTPARAPEKFPNAPCHPLRRPVHFVSLHDPRDAMPAVSPQDLELLEVMAAVLDGLCEDNQDMRLTSPTIFDSVARPAMSIQAYLVRLRRYTKFDITCFPVAVLYLADLCEAHGPAFCPTYHNIHRLLVTALLVASKANDDVFHANFFMAQCGGINLAELNKLEVELCTQLGWKLVPTNEALTRLVGALRSPKSPVWTPMANSAAEPAAADADAATARTGGSRSPADDSPPKPARNLFSKTKSSNDLSPTSSGPASPRSVMGRNLSLSSLLNLLTGSS